MPGKIDTKGRLRLALAFNSTFKEIVMPAFEEFSMEIADIMREEWPIGKDGPPHSEAGFDVTVDKGDPNRITVSMVNETHKEDGKMYAGYVHKRYRTGRKPKKGEPKPPRRILTKEDRSWWQRWQVVIDEAVPDLMDRALELLTTQGD